MDRCDVLIVGGGPGGSACACALVARGLEVTLVDARSFPRDKVCAGWITPPVVSMLDIDLDEYRAERVLQPIHGFCLSIEGGPAIEIGYPEVVSYGIRRCEFDHYLLKRSGARVVEGHRVRALRREGERWIVDGRFETRVLVGAGGHTCPVARRLQGEPERHLIAARELEIELPPRAWTRSSLRAELPEIEFLAGLDGYGWAVRKQGWINLGLGHQTERGRRDGAPPLEGFIARLEAEGRIPPHAGALARGHAYLTRDHARRPLAIEGAVLIGDAAGLAHPRSGEGIRPAIASGLIAAELIATSTPGHLAARYPAELERRLPPPPPPPRALGRLPIRWRTPLARWGLRLPGVARRIIESEFLARS